MLYLMELNIEELSNMNDFQVEENLTYENPTYENLTYENLIQEKEKEKPKPSVRFVEPPKIPRQIPRQVVSKQPVPRPAVKPVPRPTMSYDDILAKMGMYVDNGKLHLMNTQVISQPHVKKEINQPPPQLSSALKSEMKNSYIYNKYFKDLAPNTNTPQQPKTVAEYQQYLLQEIALQKIAKLRQLQYRKIIIPQPPTYNDVYSDPNKLFDFSKR